MDHELTQHIIDIKTSMGKMESNVTNIKENLDQHVMRDEAKFRDLYTRHEKLDRFQARTKGVAKGVGIVAGIASAVVGAYAKAKGML